MTAFNHAPWMEAPESQLDALRFVKLFLSNAPPAIRDLKAWNIDRRLLETATPFAWSAETMRAVMAAGESIPLDTPLNKWNLETETVWWRFDEPLPYQMVSDAGPGIRALCFGWIPTEAQDFGLPVCCWIDEPRMIRESSQSFPSRVSPSQTFEWEKGHYAR